MRSEKEIKKLLKECQDAPKDSLTDDCPLEEDGEGCCAECSLPSALDWVLGNSDHPHYNLQQKVIEHFKEKK